MAGSSGLISNSKLRRKRVELTTPAKPSSTPTTVNRISEFAQCDLPCGLWRFSILDVPSCLHGNVGGEFVVQLAFEIAPFKKSTENEAQHIFCHRVLTRGRARRKRPGPVVATCPALRPVVFCRISSANSTWLADCFPTLSTPSLASLSFRADAGQGRAIRFQLITILASALAMSGSMQILFTQRDTS